MDRKILASGLVILVVGIFLITLFWPLYGVSGEDLEDKKEDDQYDSYSDGDEVTIYGTITDTSSVPNWLVEIGVDEGVWVEIDGDTTFLIKGKSEIDFSEGDDIYCSLVLKSESVGIADVTYEYWKADASLRSKTTVDYLFYSVTGLGLLITAAGVIKDY